MEKFIFGMECIGTIAFAISGAMMAAEKKMDLFGIIIMGIITAVGGGLLRDLILGISPPLLFQNPVYVITAGVSSVCVVLILCQNPWRERAAALDKIYLLMDSLGLGIFTTVGVATAYGQSDKYQMGLYLFVGVITGVGGGMLRDVFLAEIPQIFYKHVYALASVAGAMICILLWKSLERNTVMLAGVAVIAGIRVLAIRYQWDLPRISINSRQK